MRPANWLPPSSKRVPSSSGEVALVNVGRQAGVEAEAGIVPLRAGQRAAAGAEAAGDEHSPSGSSVAVCWARAAPRLAAGSQVPLVGS